MRFSTGGMTGGENIMINMALLIAVIIGITIGSAQNDVEIEVPSWAAVCSWIVFGIGMITLIAALIVLAITFIGG